MYTNSDDALIRQRSEELRTQFGMFDSEAKLNAAALTSPLQALKKCLGISRLIVGSAVLEADARTVADRAEHFRISRA